MSKQRLNGHSPILSGADVSSPPETSRYPVALQIALEQLAVGFRQHGHASLASLFAEKDAYPKVIATLEKLCKCALEFDQLQEETAGSMPVIKGISKETDAQLTLKLQGL